MFTCTQNCFIYQVPKPTNVHVWTLCICSNSSWVMFTSMHTHTKDMTVWQLCFNNLIHSLLDNKVWRTVWSAPSKIGPTYGHSSVLHPDTGRIYIHGGYRMLNSTCFKTSSDTFYFHPKSKGWNFQYSSSVPRFLHSAVVVGSTMIVFGGRGDSGMVSQHLLMVFDIGEWFHISPKNAFSFSFFFFFLEHSFNYLDNSRVILTSVCQSASTNSGEGRGESPEI